MRKTFLAICLSLGTAGSAAATDSLDNVYPLAAAAFAGGHAEEAYKMLAPFFPANRGTFKFDLLFGESACHTASADMWGAQYLLEMSRHYESELKNNEEEHKALMKADIACVGSLRPNDHAIFQHGDS